MFFDLLELRILGLVAQAYLTRIRPRSLDQVVEDRLPIAVEQILVHIVKVDDIRDGKVVQAEFA